MAALVAALGRLIVFGMAVLAVFVQLAVWGATKIRTDGALLSSWQRYFGWPYGVAFAVAQIGVCLWFGIERGTIWLLRTWAVAGLLLVLAWLAAGRPDRLTIDDSVALVSGLGAVVLAVALYDNRLDVR